MAKKLPDPKNFEDAIGELERILSEMERGEVPLEDSLVRYERGNQLIQFCRAVLGKAEQQIEQMQKPADEPALSGPATGGLTATQAEAIELASDE